MLVLMRRFGQKLFVMAPSGETVTVKVTEIQRGKTKIGIDAPLNWNVCRDDVAGMSEGEVLADMRRKMEGFAGKERTVSKMELTSIFVALPHGWSVDLENGLYVGTHGKTKAKVQHASAEPEEFLAKVWQAHGRLRKAMTGAKE